MKKSKPEKKSDSLEIRVAPDEKATFLQTCRHVGLTGSDVLRQSMRAFVQRHNSSRFRKGIAMIAITMISFLGWMSVASIQAAAAPINTDVDVQFRQISDQGTLSTRRMSTQLDMALGETVTLYVDDDGPLSLASFFEPSESIVGPRIRIDLTARPAALDDQVTYNAVLRLMDTNGELVGDPIEPELTVEFGSQAEIVIGFDIVGSSDETLEIGLRPNA